MKECKKRGSLSSSVSVTVGSSALLRSTRITEHVQYLDKHKKKDLQSSFFTTASLQQWANLVCVNVCVVLFVKDES